MLTLEIQDKTETWQDDPDSDNWMAEEAARMGFPVAGFMKEIYEDAVILIPPLFRFDWSPGKVAIGRVIHIQERGQVWTFVLCDKNGIQSTRMFGKAYPVHFALPEDSENFPR